MLFTSHKINIQGLHGKLCLVEKGPNIPHTHPFYVEVDGTEAYTELFEEEWSLGRFTITNIPRGDRYCLFGVTIGMDGILHVFGEFSNGKKVDVKCSIQRNELDENQMTIIKQKLERLFVQQK